jgi:hypothetical protein
MKPRALLLHGGPTGWVVDTATNDAIYAWVQERAPRNELAWLERSGIIFDELSISSLSVRRRGDMNFSKEGP